MKTLTFKLNDVTHTQEIPYDARPRKISAFSVSGVIKVISSAPGKLVDPGTPKSTTTLLFDFSVIGNEDMTGLTTYTEGITDMSLTADTEAEEAEIKAQEQEQAKAEAEAVLAQKSRVNLIQTMSFTASEFSLLAKAELFPVWTVGETYPQGRRILHDGIVYEVVAADGVTAEAHRPPDGEGLLAVYRPLSTDPETGTTPTGTQDDPIPYIDGMDVEEGKYYSYNGKLYLANANLPACVWPPDTEGLWQWTEVTETA